MVSGKELCYMLKCIDRKINTAVVDFESLKVKTDDCEHKLRYLEEKGIINQYELLILYSYLYERFNNLYWFFKYLNASKGKV